MLDLWSLVRFLHLVGAVVWLGGQLTASALVTPVACDRLSAEARKAPMRILGMRFVITTANVLIPPQVATGVAQARHKEVTEASRPNRVHGRTLTRKPVAFALVMLAAGLHGWAIAGGHRTLARPPGGVIPGWVICRRPARYRLACYLRLPKKRLV